jgi:hypothetical protein
VKAIGILGGAMSKPGTNQLNIFNATDNIVPAIVMHGAKDAAIPIGGVSTEVYNESEIKAQLLTNNIPFLGYVTCNGNHEVVTYNGLPNNAAIASGDVITSQQVDMFNSNNFLDIQYVGKPYTTASVDYFSATTHPDNNKNMIKYFFLGKQVYDIGKNLAFWFNLATTSTPASFITNFQATAGNPALINTFSPFKTTDFPFSYPNQYNGIFIPGTCSTLVTLKKEDMGITSARQSIRILNRFAGEDNLSVYPAIANNFINLNFSVKNTSAVSISIYDMIGKNVSVVMNNETIEMGYYNKQLDVSNLPGGIYKVVMNNSSGDVITKSLVIQK